MNYIKHFYCSPCRAVFSRKSIRKKIPICPICGKMLRRSPRKKNEKLLKRIDLGE